MSRRRIHYLLSASAALCAAIVLTATVSSAESEPKTMKPAATQLSYLRLYADSSGVSHFAEEKLELRASSTGTGESALAALRLEGVQGASFVALKTGAVEDWHNAPRRQFIIGLRGEAQVTAGDGQVRRVTPGTIVLVEDTTGKGHITKSTGTEDHVAIVVPVPAR